MKTVIFYIQQYLRLHSKVLKKIHTPIILLIMPFNLDLESAKKQSGYRDTGIFLSKVAGDEWQASIDEKKWGQEWSPWKLFITNTFRLQEKSPS